MADFSITTINQSTSPFKLYYWDAPSNALSTINTQPNDTLLGGNGKEVLSWTNTNSTMGAGDPGTVADGQVIWKAPSGKAFGINIHQPVQVLLMGTSPYYQVKTEPDGGWNGEHRSDPYTFPADIGFNVVVRAVAEHSHIYVTATISDSS